MNHHEPHPLSTQMLLERAATASTEPDLHHVEAAYRAARALALLGDDDGCVGPDFDYTRAADVAALEMALAAASALARRIYDHPANGGPAELSDFLYRILTHHVRDFEQIMADLERLADDDQLAALPSRDHATRRIG